MNFTQICCFLSFAYSKKGKIIAIKIYDLNLAQLNLLTSWGLYLHHHDYNSSTINHVCNAAIIWHQ